MAFAYKFIIFYLAYVMIWVAMWQTGFAGYYTQSITSENPLSYSGFVPSLSGSYKNSSWVPVSMFDDTQLHNLDMGTQVSLCLDCTQYSIYTLKPNYYWIIYGKYTITTLFIFTDYYYNVTGFDYKYVAFNSTINANEIMWINTRTTKTLSAYQINSTTSTGQIVTAEATLNPTDLWAQITLFFGIMSGFSVFSNNLWYLGLINTTLFLAFLYCVISEILIPFGIKIPFV